MPKAHAVHDGRGFCMTCYAREFVPVDCSDCGVPMRSYHGETPVKCKSCQVKGRVCAGCQKPLARASLVTEDGAFCWPCAKKRRQAIICPMCGEPAQALSRAPSLDIDIAVCERCRNSKTHFTCNQCGKYRKPKGLNAKGIVVCGTCLRDGEYVCRQCGKPGQRHSANQCTECYWNGRSHQLVASGVAALQRPWAKMAYRGYGEHLIRERGAQRTCVILPSQLAFFIKLDTLFLTSEAVYVRDLVEHFGVDGLRANDATVNFLIRNGYLPAVTARDCEGQNEVLRQRRFIEAEGEVWYSGLLTQFFESNLRMQTKTRIKRRKGISPRTLTSWLLAARQFLRSAHAAGIVRQSELGSSHVEAFLRTRPGYRASLARFVEFLNQETKRFGRIKIVRKTQTSNPELVLEGPRRDALLRKFLDPETPAKEALLGILHLLYAQTPTRATALGMSQLGRDESGLHTIRFSRLPIPIDSEVGAVLDRYLAERREMVRDDLECPYLFPGRRVGAHASPSTLVYYFRRWGVTGPQLFASSLVGMFSGEVTHPNVPVAAFGVSLVAAGKYYHLCNPMARDDVQHHLLQSERA